MAEEPALETAAAPSPSSAQSLATKSKDPNRPLTFRYWKRPTYLQYKILYDYRTNYYDDVIDYLDRRSRGYYRDIPRPQVWAERALRTYMSTNTEVERRRQKDIELLAGIRNSTYNYQYHKWESMARRYPALLL